MRALLSTDRANHRSDPSGIGRFSRMRGRGSTAGVWQRRVVPALLGLALVGGCTGVGADPAESTGPPVVEVTTTPTPTPTPVVKPEPPEAMSEPTTDGAIAAATYFLALSDYAFASGDSEPLLAMSAEGCTYCAYVDEQVESMVAGKYTSEADPLEVLTATSTEIRPDEWFSALLRVEQDFTRARDTTGAVVDETGKSVVDFLFAISWLGDEWRVEQVGLTEVSA